MTAPKTTTQRQPAEQEFAEELAVLAKADTRQRPPQWKLSPWAVVTYLVGGTVEGETIHAEVCRRSDGSWRSQSPRWRRDRALLLLGLPGTARAG